MKQGLIALALFVPGLALAAINVNTASKEELTMLPGIGPAKAQAIVDHRKAHGPFKTVEGLKDVKGVGAKRFEKIKGDLTVSGPTTGVAKVAKADAGPAKVAHGEGAGGRRDAPAKP